MLGTLEDLAGRVGGRVVGDGGVPIETIASIDDARPGALTFATSPAYLAAACRSDATAVLIDESLAQASAPKPLLVVENARAALAALLESLRAPRPRGPFRHPAASVSPDASLAQDVYVEAHAYVGSGVSIGSGSVVGAGAYIGEGSSLGESVWVKANASVMPGCVLGDRVVLHSGCVIGSDGFGWTFVGGRAERIPASR